MALILRQSTSKAVSFGPFVDKTDGVTPEVGLVSAIDHATTGILLSKNGGALTIRSQAVTASTYDAYGNYIVTLSTTDTNTVGTLRMQFIETATCLPVWLDFQVVEEATYDALYAASAPGPATPTNITGGTITTVTNLTNAPTNGDLTATMKASVTTAVPTAAVNAAATWDLDATAHQTQGTFGQAIGDPAADTNTIFKAVVTDADGATVGVDVTNLPTNTELATSQGTADDATLAAIAALNNLSAAQVATELGTYDAPTNAEMVAAFTEIKGATWAATDTLEAIRDKETDIETDTAVIGALGAGLTALATQTSVNDLPTNAELATALGTADDAVLAQVALVKAKTDLIPGTIDGKTFAEIVTLEAAVLLGKASGLETATAVYRAIDDVKDRVTATVDADGNRSSVILDPA